MIQVSRKVHLFRTQMRTARPDIGEVRSDLRRQDSILMLKMGH